MTLGTFLVNSLGSVKVFRADVLGVCGETSSQGRREIGAGRGGALGCDKVCNVNLGQGSF